MRWCVHKILQDDLDSAQLEIIETRANETTLEAKIDSLKEKIAEMQNRSASALGRKVIHGRRESSGTFPTMQALLEEEEQGAGGEQSDMITGSELVVTGGILKKEGSRRFTCFGNGNPYHDLVKESIRVSLSTSFNKYYKQAQMSIALQTIAICRYRNHFVVLSFALKRSGSACSILSFSRSSGVVIGNEIVWSNRFNTFVRGHQLQLVYLLTTGSAACGSYSGLLLMGSAVCMVGGGWVFA